MSASIKKLFVAVLIVVALSTIMSTSSTAGTTAGTFYTCNKTKCYSYESTGRAHMITVLGYTWHGYVWQGTSVYATNVGRGWLKQSMFWSQSIYYKTADFIVK